MASLRHPAIVQVGLGLPSQHAGQLPAPLGLPAWPDQSLSLPF